MVSHTLRVSGAPNSLLRQAKYFKEAGYEVDIWTLEGGNLIEKYRTSGFEPLNLKNDSWFNINKAWQVSKKDYDLVVCNTIITYKVADFFAKCQIPTVWFIRETGLVEDICQINSQAARILKKFDNLYTVSDYAANILRKYNPNVKVINNAVPDNFIKQTAIGKKIRLGYIGSIIPIKGVDVLCKAFTIAKAVNPDISLTIAGDYNNSFGKKIFEQYNKISELQWLGEVEQLEKQKFFDNIDVLVVPSLDEPSGLTVMEGVMQGKIVITTTKVGANYLIEEGKNGFIIEPNDSKALAKAVIKLLDNSVEELTEMQKQARKSYLRSANIDRERQDVLHMFSDNCKKNSHGNNNKEKKYWLEIGRGRYNNRRILYFKGKKIFSWKPLYGKKKLVDGTREIYLFGKCIFSYHGNKKIIKAKSVNYKTYNDLLFDIKNNITKIPTDVDLVVGIPRSGMIPAYMIGLVLNKQVCSLSEFTNGIFGEHGQTKKVYVSSKLKKILLVDDTVNSGASMARVRERLKNYNQNFEFCYLAIYSAGIEASKNVDVALNIVSQPRIFAWNYLYHSLSSNYCYDMDGVLCVDPSEEENDDGENYLQFIYNAKSLYIPNHKIGYIVTSRLEKYRKQTEEWLKKHHIEYNKLYMFDGTYEERRKFSLHAKFKAEIFKKLKDSPIFIESNKNQAQQIASLSGKKVICASNDEIYLP